MENNKVEYAVLSAHITNYIPTPEDRENDRLAEEWKERRREEARETFVRNQMHMKKYAI